MGPQSPHISVWLEPNRTLLRCLCWLVFRWLVFRWLVVRCFPWLVDGLPSRGHLLHGLRFYAFQPLLPHVKPPLLPHCWLPHYWLPQRLRNVPWSSPRVVLLIWVLVIPLRLLHPPVHPPLHPPLLFADTWLAALGAHSERSTLHGRTHETSRASDERTHTCAHRCVA